MTAATVTHDEVRELVADALGRDRRSAKVIALRTGATPRAVESWRQREHSPSVPYFIALAREFPELRAAVRRWLELDAALDPEAERALIDIGLSLSRRRQTALEARQAELESEGGR